MGGKDKAQFAETVPKSFAEIFEEDFPYYLSIGMSYELYWYGDVWLVNAYREAYKRKLQETNSLMHIQAAYLYEALLDVSPVLHAFAKQGTKPIPFREKPYPLFGVDDKEKTEEDKTDQLSEEQEALRAKIYMKQMARALKNHFGDTAAKAVGGNVQTPRE